MPKWTRDYLLTLVLGGLAAVLALALAVEWAVLDSRREAALARPAVKASTAEAATAETEDEDGLEFPGLEDFAQMVERPLFMESRRPGEDEPPPPPQQTQQTPLNLKLMGVVATPKDKLVLMLDAKGKYKRLRLNETLDGWTLVELGTDRVVMQQGQERKPLDLLKARPKLPGGALPGGAQPPGPQVQGPQSRPLQPGVRPPPPPPPPEEEEEDPEFSEDEEDADFMDEGDGEEDVETTEE
jgi:hypothetical protein